jgi:hypothetical protein
VILAVVGGTLVVLLLFVRSRSASRGAPPSTEAA